MLTKAPEATHDTLEAHVQVEKFANLRGKHLVSMWILFLDEPSEGHRNLAC